MGGPKPGGIPLNKRNTMHLNCNNNAELEIADTYLPCYNPTHDLWQNSQLPLLSPRSGTSFSAPKTLSCESGAFF
jgi:hypothetical protein